MFNKDILKKEILELSPEQFYVKHILKSQNWYFVNYLKVPPVELVDRIDCFKEIVSSKLKISFHNLQMVGSAKIGYSLSPYKPFNPFHEESVDEKSSDIDIAIVSDKLYFEFWDKLRHSNIVYREEKYYRKLTSAIFKGFINEKQLLRITNINREWREFVNPVNVALQDRLGFVHPITYRVYRSWDDLEDYQIFGISQIKRKVENGDV